MNSYPPVPTQYAGWADLFNVLYLVCACSGAVVTAAKAMAWWKERSPELLALVVTRCITIVAFLGGMPWLQDHLAQATDVPNIGTLITYPCIVIQSLASQLILRFWQQDRAEAWRTARWLVALYALIIPGMIVLFLVASIPVNRPIDFDVYYATTPSIAIFQLIYNTCYAAGLIANILMLRKYAAMVDGMPWTRRGLNITMLGSMCGLAMFATKVPSLLALWFGYDFLNFANVVIGPLLAVISALLHQSGSTLPAWGSRLEQSGHLFRCYLRMQPLWHAIAQVRPDIAYAPVPSSRLAAAWKVFALKQRLYRAVIEIRDGERELRPYFDPEIATVAHELATEAALDDEARQAVVDAAVLSAAMRAKRQDTPVPGADTVELSTTTGELSEEISSLAAIAHAFTTSPLVAAALRRVPSNYQVVDGSSSNPLRTSKETP
ncbi:MAB_1171c family putative transporter [Streptomyces sp. NPDC004647]|uniref:MAB_1171c family putative transporter n=1 Tax=Streptomyces sp. NPDC004647 TaxID=3154671 RepID=UPI0033B0147C